MMIFRRWLYILYLAIDANFRLKLKDRGVQGDDELGSGWAYFVQHDLYKEEIPKHTETIEVCHHIFFYLWYGT